MKRTISLLMSFLLILTMTVGCSSSNEKSEEELRAEIIAEMEAEEKLREELEASITAELEAEQKDETKTETKAVTRLSDQELFNKLYEYEGKLWEFINSFEGLRTIDIKDFEPYQKNAEFKEYVDMILALGYRIENLEGDYYLYVGKSGPRYAPGTESNWLKLSGFTTEKLRGEEINYSNHSAVIVEYYPLDGANIHNLTQRSFETGKLDGFEPPVIPVAFFGKVEDVKITYQTLDISQNPPVVFNGDEWNLGTLENTLLNVDFFVPSDRCAYVITGNVYIGEGNYTEFRTAVWYQENPEGLVIRLP